MSLTREQQELLETYGFDLMAQVEAMLRHVRRYQMGLQQLRGTLPPKTRQPLAAMVGHVRALRKALGEFDTSLTEIEEGTRGLHLAEPQRSGANGGSDSESA